MKIKNVLIILSISLNLALAIIIYNQVNQKEVTDIAFEFTNAVKSENYTKAEAFIAEEKEAEISTDLLKEINELAGSGTSYETYELLKFDNGNMVLLNLTPDKNLKIQGIKIIPEEMGFVFEQE